MNMILHKRAQGNIGEDIACGFIESRGFVVIKRNYLKKWGELDIIAEKDNTIHFFEVKSVTGVFSEKFFDVHKPEENIDGWKIKHLRRMVETYFYEKRGNTEAEFRFHALCVYMDKYHKTARVKWLKDIIL